MFPSGSSYLAAALPPCENLPLDRAKSVTNGLPSGNAQTERAEHFTQRKRAENRRRLRRLSTVLTNATVSLF